MIRKEETVVIIVGGGPSGLATSACLNHHAVPNVILEKEGCHCSLWKTRAYDRLKLHLAKEFCYLPRMPHPPEAPTFLSRSDFVRYLDDYVERFRLRPALGRTVESARYDEGSGKWVVVARVGKGEEEEEYTGRFLVVATGENGEGYVPELPGMETFAGEVLHSRDFKSGSKYEGERVLVVGCGNSGMEIAYDLCDHGANTSIVVRGSCHVVSKEMIHLGMALLKHHFPLWMVDLLVLLLSRIKFGDLSKHGMRKPAQGPFALKLSSGRAPVIDVGTVGKIKAGKIQVLPAASSINGDEVAFVNGRRHRFDAIVFATGYVSTAKKWLKDDKNLLEANGMPRRRFPNHWKGENGLYCVGLAWMGLSGISRDAQAVADDIKNLFYRRRSNTYHIY